MALLRVKFDRVVASGIGNQCIRDLPVCELGTEQVLMGEAQQLWDTGQHVSQVGLAWANGCIESCVLRAGRGKQT
jgi:hypothetical protein